MCLMTEPGAHGGKLHRGGSTAADRAATVLFRSESSLRTDVDSEEGVEDASKKGVP